jgi:hypothetical protein
MKTTIDLSQNGESLSKKLNPGPPEYEGGVLTTAATFCPMLFITNNLR